MILDGHWMRRIRFTQTLWGGQSRRILGRKRLRRILTFLPSHIPIPSDWSPNSWSRRQLEFQGKEWLLLLYIHNYTSITILSGSLRCIISPPSSLSPFTLAPIYLARSQCSYVFFSVGSENLVISAFVRLALPCLASPPFLASVLCFGRLYGDGEDSG